MPNDRRDSGDDSRRHKRRHDESRPGPVEQLDARKSAILNAVVTEHVETAQPVGSSHVSVGVGVSSATVRSEMSALERDGFLMQPHTSAGRIPTDRGYRYFVDHLSRPGVLGPVQNRQVRAFYAHVHGEVEEMLERTSRLLAGLTDHVSVVVGHRHDTSAVRSVQIVGIAPQVAVLVVVLADGAVEKRTLDFAEEITSEALAAASTHLCSHFVGSALERTKTLPETGDPSVDEVTQVALVALSELAGAREPDNVFVGGASSMASAFDAVETVRSVLSILEQQLVVVELIEDVLDRGLSVAIGAEHGFEPLASCALVVAPVELNGEELGTIGILGPTRMNYPRALAAVRLVGDELAERLTRHRTDDLEGSHRGN
ncbi:MAG: heat-inducible transcriptional repressor HrcA [Acidimicrobiales bacterium]